MLLIMYAFPFFRLTKRDVAMLKSAMPAFFIPAVAGNLFDIEDFGIKLSTGITCPEHWVVV